MRTTKLAITVFLLATAPAFAAPPVFEAWRYTTEAVGARDADRIAWINQQGGATQLLAATGPHYQQAIVITAAAPNDGQPVEALSISANGQWLAWDRGGVGDPAGSGALTERGVWVAGPDNSLCRLGEGGRPTLSPANDRVAWMARGRLLVAPLNRDCEAMKAMATEIASGGVVAPLWSPDGAALAFEQPIGRARRIGVWASGALRWLDNAAQLDVGPAWSPDSRKVAFLRIDPTDDALANQFDEDPPSRFSVMVMSAEDLKPTPVWTSPGADGFARQWRSRTTAPVMWLNADHLGFLSEHAGWQHIYRVSLTGEPVTDLTPGPCETDYADVANGQLITSDNCDGVDGRTLRRIDTAGIGRLNLSQKAGVGVQPFLFNGARSIVYRVASGPVQTVEVRTGDTLSQPQSPAADPFDGIATESVVIKTADGLTLNGQLYRPKDQRPHAALIFLHGGPQRQTFLAGAPSAFYSRFGWMNRALARRGYVVLQLNYRSGNGQGRDFRRIRGVARNGAAEFKDVLAARGWLAGRGDVNAHRIGLWGDSWGGWLTSLSLARRSDLFASGVVISGVYDLSQTSFGPLLNPQAREMAKASSAAGSIETWRSPVLIVHGGMDNTVSFKQAQALEAALKAHKQPVETLYFPREGHAFQLEKDWSELFDRASEFLDRTLKP